MWFPRPPNGPPLRCYDQEGLLASSGYQWDERMPPKYLGCGIVAAAAFALSVFLFANVSAAAGIGALVTSVIGAAGCIYYWRCRPTVIFHRDGRVETPFGVPRKPWARFLPVDQTKISTIEAVRQKDSACIELVTVDGETCIVGSELRFADARLIAVQLSKALRELRDSMATLKSANQVQRIKADLID